MASKIRKEDVRKLIGKEIFAVKKDGTRVAGKLVRINGNTLIVASAKGKKVQTKAIVPLVLFDLLAIGTSPFAFGGFGGWGGGFGYPYGGFGWGGPGFW
ncbi:hypothetical protein ACFPOG_15610 [Paenibacillus aestuarii]|uniref:50S ribosomal protein L33 n=1 Tax=Paenibacillus aestuarii TaxID=516965 RepID=A0ABW0K9L5_9BACL